MALLDDLWGSTYSSASDLFNPFGTSSNNLSATMLAMQQAQLRQQLTAMAPPPIVVSRSTFPVSVPEAKKPKTFLQTLRLEIDEWIKN